MAIFLNESCSKLQHLCIWSDDKDATETKVHIRKPIIHFSKSKCHVSPPSLPSRSTKNLKAGKVLLLSSHTETKESVPSYQLLHLDKDAKKKSWVKLPFQGEFSYTSLHWEWLEDFLTRCRGLLVVNLLFDAFYLSFICLWQVSKSCSGNMWILVPRNRNLCISQRAKFLFLYWASMATSGFHFRDFFMTKLSPIQETQD